MTTIKAFNTITLLASILVPATIAQHYTRTPVPERFQESDGGYRVTPQILSHQQALNHDGNFRYLFNTENGLAQGESIAPDGSRNGRYSYIDPTGRKISVKYTAGKEGFRILEADHLPKAPEAPAPVAPHAAPQPAPYAAPRPVFNSGENRYDDGQYRPEVYERPESFAPRPYPAAAPSRSAPYIHSAEVKEPEYNDAPGKPFSFGPGYAFEFAG